MRLLYITQTFPPEPGPTLRPLEQARCLVRHGHHVRVITTFPYYPSGVLLRGDRAVLWRREQIDGIEVLRVASLPAPNRGRWRRIASWGSFAAHAALAGLIVSKPDAVIASVPNAGTEAAGICIARALRIPFILELRDLLPESMQLGGLERGSPLYLLAHRWFRAVYRRADAIAVPSEGMVEALASAHGIERSRILWVPHGAERDRFVGASGGAVRRRLNLEGKFVAAYAGSFSSYYGVGNLVEAAARTSSDDRVHWLLIGDGADRAAVARRIREARLSNVTLVDAMAPTDIVEWLAAADVCVTSLRTSGALPYAPDRLTKVCDYLALGKPILAVESEQLSAPFLAAIGAGESVPWADPVALARAVVELANDAVRCARLSAASARFAERELPRDQTMRALLAWLDVHKGKKSTGGVHVLS